MIKECQDKFIDQVFNRQMPQGKCLRKGGREGGRERERERERGQTMRQQDKETVDQRYQIKETVDQRDFRSDEQKKSFQNPFCYLKNGLLLLMITLQESGNSDALFLAICEKKGSK